MRPRKSGFSHKKRQENAREKCRLPALSSIITVSHLRAGTKYTVQSSWAKKIDECFDNVPMGGHRHAHQPEKRFSRKNVGRRVVVRRPLFVDGALHSRPEAPSIEIVGRTVENAVVDAIHCVGVARVAEGGFWKRAVEVSVEALVGHGFVCAGAVQSDLLKAVGDGEEGERRFICWGLDRAGAADKTEAFFGYGIHSDRLRYSQKSSFSTLGIGSADTLERRGLGSIPDATFFFFFFQPKSWKNLGKNLGKNLRKNLRKNLWKNLRKNLWKNLWKNPIFTLGGINPGFFVALWLSGILGSLVRFLFLLCVCVVCVY
jgi:hypothetical protein